MNIRTFDNFAVAYQALRAGQVQAVTSIDGVAAEYDQRGDFPRVLNGLFPTPVSVRHTVARAGRCGGGRAGSHEGRWQPEGAIRSLWCFDVYG